MDTRILLEIALNSLKIAKKFRLAAGQGSCNFSVCIRYSSRKPQDGGGSGTPGDSLLIQVSRVQPEVGIHLAGSLPGVHTHGPGWGHSHSERCT